MKFILLLTTAFVLCTAVVSNAQAQPENTRITVKVKGVTCSTDLKMIQANVEKLEGVTECSVGKRGTTTSFEITFNAKTLTEEDLYATIEGTGSCEDPDERPYKVKRKKE